MEPVQRDLRDEQTARSIFFRPQEIVVMDGAGHVSSGSGASSMPPTGRSGNSQSSSSSVHSLRASWKNLSDGGPGGVDGLRGIMSSRTGAAAGSNHAPGIADFMRSVEPSVSVNNPAQNAAAAPQVAWDRVQQQRYDQSREVLMQSLSDGGGGHIERWSQDRPMQLGSEWIGGGRRPGAEHAAEKLYHTRVTETLGLVERVESLRGQLVAGRDALHVVRAGVADARAQAIGKLQRQFGTLQAELLAELRRSVAAVEAAEHVIARPVQAEVDALERRIADIDRLGELARLKIRVEPQHRFVEYTRLLHQDLRSAAAPVYSVLDPSVDLEALLGTVKDKGFVQMPAPPEVHIVVGQTADTKPRTRDAVIQTGNYGAILKELRDLSCWLATQNDQPSDPASSKGSTMEHDSKEANKAGSGLACGDLRSGPGLGRFEESSAAVAAKGWTDGRFAISSNTHPSSSLAALEHALESITEMYSAES